MKKYCLVDLKKYKILKKHTNLDIAQTELFDIQKHGGAGAENIVILIKQ